MDQCHMCRNLNGLARVDRWNEPILESPNFAVLASLGAVVEGWLLLVPKQHMIALGAVPESMAGELQELKEVLHSVLQQAYGHVCAFEHGPSKANCSIGCGVDHAHLHMVPVQFDLASAVAPFLPKGAVWADAGLAECRAAFGRGQDYLYLEQPIGVGRITTHGEIGSQLFRRAIATEAGVPDEFNWREYPKLSNVMETIERVRARAGTMAESQKYLGAAV